MKHNYAYTSTVKTADGKISVNMENSLAFKYKKQYDESNLTDFLDLLTNDFYRACDEFTKEQKKDTAKITDKKTYNDKEIEALVKDFNELMDDYNALKQNNQELREDYETLNDAYHEALNKRDYYAHQLNIQKENMRKQFDDFFSSLG